MQPKVHTRKFSYAMTERASGTSKFMAEVLPLGTIEEKKSPLYTSLCAGK